MLMVVVLISIEEATEGGNFEGFKILTSTVEVENLNNILVLQ